MPHFEVHTYARDRWLIDGIFSDKETAVDDAKLLMGRTRAFDAVRVLQVEEEPQGFQEWTVYVAARPRRRRRWRRAAAAPAASAPRPATPAPLTRTHPPSAAPALLLLIALTLAGLLMLSSQRPSQPKWVWVFDRPEAWQTHELRNPWTGDVSR
jgi:hypothetical protein